MKAFRFIHRQTNKKIVFRTNSFAQAVSDLYATLGREKADQFKFGGML